MIGNNEWDWKKEFDWTDPDDVPYESKEDEDLKEVVYGKWINILLHLKGKPFTLILLTLILNSKQMGLYHTKLECNQKIVKL